MDDELVVEVNEPLTRLMRTLAKLFYTQARTFGSEGGEVTHDILLDALKASLDEEGWPEGDGPGFVSPKSESNANDGTLVVEKLDEHENYADPNAKNDTPAVKKSEVQVKPASSSKKRSASGSTSGSSVKRLKTSGSGNLK